MEYRREGAGHRDQDMEYREEGVGCIEEGVPAEVQVFV